MNQMASSGVRDDGLKSTLQARRGARLGAWGLLATGMLLVGCHKKSDATADMARAAASAEAKKAAVPVKFQRPTSKMLPQTIEVSGTLAADETSEVATQVAGQVVAVNVDVGSHVKKGDVLVQLDAREAQLRSAQASATRDQAWARLALPPNTKFDPTLVPDVKAAKETMDLAVADAERSKSLFDSGAISQASWDAARTNSERAKAQYDMALAGAKQALATYSSAQAAAGLAGKSLTDTAIRAPFDGAIAEKRVSPGEFASVGKVMVVVVQDNPLRMRMDIAEADIGKVAVGNQVAITVSAYPDRVFMGTMKRIGASLKATSRALPVEAEVKNDDGVLKSGLFAKARLEVPGGTTKALLLPEAALGSTGQTFRIFVKSGTNVTERLVVPGRRMDGMVEVVGNLAETDEVAVTSIDKLSDGAEVAAQPLAVRRGKHAVACGNMRETTRLRDGDRARLERGRSVLVLRAGRRPLPQN